MGLLSPSGKGGGRSFGQRLGGLFDMDRLAVSQALLNGDYAAAASLGARSQQAEADRARVAHQQQVDQTASDDSRMRQEGLGLLGYTKPQIQVLSPADASQIVREQLIPRQFASTGGTVRSVNPATGAPSYEFAPSEREIGRSIIRTDPQGQTNTIFQGVEPVAVTDGGSVYGWNNQGPVTGGAPPTGTPPQPSPTAPAVPRRPGPSASAPRSYGDPVAELTQIAGMPPSSGFRTQGHQDDLVRRGMTRTRTGAHQRRDGLDFPIPAGPRQQQVAATIRQRYPQAQFAFEGTNLHVSLPGWGGAPDVSGSARRFPDRRSVRQPVRMNTPQQAARLPPGTEFVTPDGVRRVRH